MNSWKKAIDVSTDMVKSYHKLQGRYFFQGFPISIENKKGSWRRGTDRDGNSWATRMKLDYGYIRGTLGVDGDEVDCFVGPNKFARNVYIIRAKAPNGSGRSWSYDEDKCFLGFNSKSTVKEAFLSHYDKREFLGSIDTYPVEVFRDKVHDKKNHGKMVKGFVSISERIS
tara:strand:- start:1074 stop:1583 length:510 start_codon:yes stop_codon:yes gene_type:complete